MFVLPTANEPFGIVILEAWAAGTPVIATRVGGIPGFTTDEKNILLTDDNDDSMLAEKIERLSGSPELKHTLRSNGLDEVSTNYDWSAITERVMAIYEEVQK